MLKEGEFLTINSQSFIFRDSKLVCKLHKTHTHFIQGKIEEKKSKINLITLDIETRTLNGKMIPYCICYYDGRNKKSFYLSDYTSVDNMLLSCIKSLFIPKYFNHKIYIHNLSNFDGVFLLRILALFAKEHNLKINIIKRDSAIISITLEIPVKNKIYSIEFRDSLLTLPAALRKLAKSFRVEDKGIFPYNFVNDSNINLDYIGSIPQYSFFNDVREEDYIKYSKLFLKNNWSLRKETIKYCIQDCVSLHQILFKFNSLIFDMFNVTISKYPTLPSLAFAIFRTRFMAPNIPKLVGDIYHFIRKSYTGGAVDVYNIRPIPSGSTVKGYDVNSLYPTSMSNMDMPVGEPIFFDPTFDLSSISATLLGFNINDKPFGFFNVAIETPSNLEHPIIQTRVKTVDGWRTP